MVPSALNKSVVSLWVLVLIDAAVLLGLAIFFMIGMFASFDSYYGPDEEDILALVMIAGVMAVVLTCGVVTALVATQLKRQRYWAWVMAVIVSSLSLISFPAIIFGVISLIGLFNEQVVAWFKKQPTTQV